MIVNFGAYRRERLYGVPHDGALNWATSTPQEAADLIAFAKLGELRSPWDRLHSPEARAALRLRPPPSLRLVFCADVEPRLEACK